MYDLFENLVIRLEILKENGYLYFENDDDSQQATYQKDNWKEFSFMPDNDSKRKCTRCSKLFNLNSTFSSQCQYHPLKTEIRQGFQYHSCCLQRVGKSKGCQTNTFHVHQQPSESVLKTFVQSPKPVSSSDFRSNKIFGLDVEMIHTMNGMEAARVSLVGLGGRVIMDEYVKPEGKIIHLNTQFSGIQMHHLEGAKTLKQIHQQMFRFLNRSSILVGHGLSNDLKVLRLVHLRVIDTGLLIGEQNGRMAALKRIAKCVLDKEIQKERRGGHDSVEDATTCIEIVEHLVMHIF